MKFVGVGVPVSSRTSRNPLCEHVVVGYRLLVLLDLHHWTMLV